MEIRIIKENEINRVCQILKNVVAQMKIIGFTQWGDDYPTREIYLNDIKFEQLYGAYVDNTLAGVIALNHYQDQEYKTIPWVFRNPCLVVHRLQVDPAFRGQNIAYDLMLYAEQLAKDKNCNSIRLDTRYDNIAAMNLYKKLKYKRRGHVHFPRMIEYVFPCFEKEIL